MRVIPAAGALLLLISVAAAQDVHVRQGVAYFQQQQYAKALEEFQQAHAERPKMPLSTI